MASNNDVINGSNANTQIIQKISNLIKMIDDNTIINDKSNNSKPWAIDPNKKKKDFRNYDNNPRQALVEQFYKEQHEKQTYDFVIKKRQEYLSFDKCVMTIWDMLHYLDKIIDDSDPDTDLSQFEHALQTAEASRAAYPDDKYDWLHVTALIHDLGKVLSTNTSGFNGDNQFCVVGDIFPVGCSFSKKNVFYNYFKNNPDYNNNKYNTKFGVYSQNCGLDNVIMSWGHDDYMYNIAKNQSKLPIEALYMLRYHSFYPWHTGGDYKYLCNKQDIDIGLKWVKIFNTFDLYSKSTDLPNIDDVADYYKTKINKYFPNPVKW